MMTLKQEDALYDFLEDSISPFSLRQVCEYVRARDGSWGENLQTEIAAFFDSTVAMAFRTDNGRWLSRRGLFQDVPFVIAPSKLELLNGILIPGHRCLPFANQALQFGQYEFFWKGKKVKKTSSEGPPEDFYLYYGLFGREYAPQLVARDNEENQRAYMDADFYEDPAEVSIRTLDMRGIFREAAFVPGDRFLVRTRDWKAGHFDLEKVGKDEWDRKELDDWARAAERGFFESFSRVGAACSAEDQIAFAYRYGGERMRQVPAYPMEEFIFEVTEGVEIVEYGIETRYWFAGRDIPDSPGLLGLSVPPDRTPVEEILCRIGIPVSELVILAYVRDALFRGEKDLSPVMGRIVPDSVESGDSDLDLLSRYVSEIMEEMAAGYNIFLDQTMGPIRRQLGEFHRAVIDFAAGVRRMELGEFWLPKHIFIMLSQLQEHAADLLGDLGGEQGPAKDEIELMDSSLENMIETFGDIREVLKKAAAGFRRSKLQVVSPALADISAEAWQTVQISLGGTEVWRRVVVPSGYTLQQMHALIQACLGWKGFLKYRFILPAPTGIERKPAGEKTRIGELRNRGVARIEYEYGQKWTVQVILVSTLWPEAGEKVRCVAGENAAPPETLAGPLRFRKLLGLLAGGNDSERKSAEGELGPDFVPTMFDKERCNREIGGIG
ncbi:MAG: plasmid pRiA4b ORF-3 family protein [Treponema sp.]|nr:plasmid pRiA4b ORF-3 family protein [Treponema sp.]